MISTLRKIAFLTAGLCALVAAQPPSPDQPPQGPVVSFEVIPFFSGDTAMPTVNVHYRIPEQFFVVLRDNDSPGGGGFVARGELLMELRNREGNSIAREIRPMDIRFSQLPREDDNRADLQGAFVLTVQPGTYTVWFSVDDLQSERSFVSRNQTVTVRAALPKVLDLSAPLLCHSEPDSLGNSVYRVLNHGTDAFFGERGGLLFNVYATGTLEDLTVHYTLNHRPDYQGMETQEFRGNDFVLHRGLARLAAERDETPSSRRPIRYHVVQAGETWKSVFVPLPLAQLHPGRLTVSLEFQTAGSKQTLERSFRVLWPDRPRSLGNIDLAVDALRHIATEEQMERFRTFSNVRYVRAFFDFWKALDADTTTAYNPAMTEYYRRVDVANDRYSSTRGLDGYKTDRGRIFILYGSPANTERLFSPHHPPREVWTYHSVKRRFVFEDQTKSGFYVLVSVEDL